MIVYQVCPRSFLDDNGDGVGDLAGVCRRIDHIAGLGVDALWLTPFFPSPMADFGYDVADYQGVDPLFGNLADFDRLVARAHQAGLKIMIDQVWSHSSEAHPWFAASRQGRGGALADRYVWADPAPDGTAPNNWLSVFGGPAWSWEPRRRQYYLHHFLSSQPAFNWWDEETAEALFATGDFWVERGVDGFRLDAVDFLLHDPSLAANPARPVADIPVKPFAMQEHRHDFGHEATAALMGRLRARFPGLVLMAELSSNGDPLDRVKRFTGPGRLDFAYSLGPMKRPGGANSLQSLLEEVAARDIGPGLVWAFSNHDVERVASRWGDGSGEAARMFLALLLALPGGICLYQGEELGLPEAELGPDDLVDPFGRAFFPAFKGRDGARTPMPWRKAAPFAGFSTNRPWLPIGPGHAGLAVDVQEQDLASTLALVRTLLAARRRSPALADGRMVPLDCGPDLVAFRREAPAQSLVCLFNPSPAPLRAPSPGLPALPGWGYAIQDAAP